MKSIVLSGSIVAVIALFLATSPTATQSSGSNQARWWQSEPYKKELGLTPDQTRKLEEIFQAAVPNQKPLKKALDEAEALFERLVEQGDKKTAAEQINRVIAARAELMKSHSLMLLEMRFVLTPQQWTKLGALQLKANDKQRAVEKPK